MREERRGATGDGREERRKGRGKKSRVHEREIVEERCGRRNPRESTRRRGGKPESDGSGSGEEACRYEEEASEAPHAG